MDERLSVLFLPESDFVFHVPHLPTRESVL